MHRADTIAHMKAQQLAVRPTMDASGNVRMMSVLNPMPTVDEWAVLSDGTVAIARGQSYRVDFVDTDGTRRSGPRLPHQWERFVDDDDKQRFLDSAKSAWNARRGAAAPSVGEDDQRSGRVPLDVIPASELPDYRPVFGRAGVLPDMDGRLWIRTLPLRGAAPGVIYDVVDRKGRLVEQVQMPTSTVVVGFGPAGIVYFVAREGMDAHLFRGRLL